MNSLKKAINLRYIYLTMKPKKNISVRAPLCDVHTDIFQFIQESVFDHNTCTVNWVPLTGEFDIHYVNFPIWGWNNSDADYDYILDEIEHCEKLSLKGMWMWIVTRNSIDDNNHNTIFSVVYYYIIIKYQYVNIIWSFISFSVFSFLLDSVMSILF